MAILLIADHNNAILNAATFNAVTAAQQVGGDIHILVAGADAGAVAQAAAQIPGVTKVLQAEAPYLAAPVAENVVATAVAIIKGGDYSHVMAPATGFGKSVAPRVLTRLLPPAATPRSSPLPPPPIRDSRKSPDRNSANRTGRN